MAKHQNIFFVGIKGVGMSALAQILKARGDHVVGWDTPERFFTNEILKQKGIQYFEGAKFKLKQKPDLAIYSQAYPESHPVRQWLKESKITQKPYAKAVAELFNAAFGILITGSHGKSTTSALIASILDQAGFNPKALIGTEVLSWHSNALTGLGKHFVLEGDEYAKAFLNYQPKLLVLTNVDWDHPDTYPTKRSYEQAFRILVKNLNKETRIVAFRGDPFLRKLLAKVPLKVYWFEASDINFKLPITLLGEHHRANAAAALNAASLLGAPRQVAVKTLTKFKGTRRRLEILGKLNGTVLIDDYGHHPTEIHKTLTALKNYAPKMPLWVVFQPHTFSRTQVFLKEFIESLKVADQVLLLEVYGSAREAKGKISGKDIAAGLKGKAVFLPSLKAAAKYASENFPEKAILVTMGAGDVWRVHEHLLELMDAQ